MRFSKADLQRLWPHADPAWLDSFARMHPALGEKYGVTTLAGWHHFLAQVSAETDGLSLKDCREEMRFHAERILEVYAKRVRLAITTIPEFAGCTPEEVARRCARNGDLLAETVYGNRVKDLGNSEPGDGAKYIGRSPLQCTGREIYTLIGRELGIDCLANPALLERPEFGWPASFIEWKHLGLPQMIARGASVEAVSRRVNGGSNGMAQRKAWFAKAKAILRDTDEPATAEARPVAEHDPWLTDVKMADVPAPADATVQTLRPLSRKLALIGHVKQFFGVSTASAGGYMTFKDIFSNSQGVADAVKALAENHVLLGVVAVSVAAIAVCGVLEGWHVDDYKSGRYVPTGASE